tara:strand:+ start:134 stop:601 length:468 start_codon:yes stop_codon:yes gene_type:complete
MSNLEERLMNAINNLLETDDTHVLNVDINKFSKNMKIQVMIDNYNGVNLDECVRISRLTEDLIKLDSEFENEYTLEVTSPGINRPLFVEEDYRNHIGSKVKILLKKMQNNTRNISGIIENIDNNCVVIKSKNKNYTIQLDNIKKANLNREIEVKK